MFSHGEETERYLQKRQGWRRACGTAYVLVGLVYLSWRLTVFNPEAPVFSALFYLAEVLMYLSGLSLIYSGWWTFRRPAPEPARDWTVDVLVPVLSEPEEMIELTLRAALKIDYPHRTWLLDDGGRPELEAMARRLGAGYLRRGSRQGAKAGNLNHALRHTSGDLVAIFDADHIARTDALDQLCGFFKDPKVGMVQAPQTFYNEDALVYRDLQCGVSRWQEQSYFYDVQQPSRDRWGAASGVGTGCVFRRAALEAIGGFPEETLTEDFHVSLKLLKAGWECPYWNEPVAWGVAAADVSEFHKTRHRWFYGNIQALALERILWCRGLTLPQRLGYLGMGTQYLDGAAQLLYLVLPPYSLIAQQIPCVASYPHIGLLLSVPALMVVLLSAQGGGFLPLLPSLVFSLGRMPMALRGFLGISGRKLPWVVSRKNVLAEIEWRLIRPMVLIFVISCAGLIFCVWNWWRGQSGSVAEDLLPGVGCGELAFFAGTYVLFNAWNSGRWIRDAIQLSRRTKRHYMFEITAPVLDEAGAWVATTRRISQDGMELESPLREGFGRDGVGHILLPSGPVRVKATPVEQGMWELATDPEEAWRLRQSLYAVDWHRMIRLCPLSQRARSECRAGPWHPAVRRGADTLPGWAMIQMPDAHQPCLLLAPAGLEADSELLLEWECEGQRRQGRARVGKEIPLNFAVPKDLNGCVCSVYGLDLIKGLIP